MPGPQGPEANKKTEGNEPLPISKTDNNATEVDKQEPPKTSPIQDTNKTTPVQANASPTVTSTSTQTATKTTTTSNQVKPVTGYRYYRDLGKQ